MNTNNVYIPSLDAKDIYLANNYIKNKDVTNITGYNLNKKNGDINSRRFINTFDFSLDLDKLREVYYNVYRKQNMTFYSDDYEKEYTYRVINVTFHYSNKSFNKINETTYVKFGYSLDDLVFNDNIALDNNIVVGIIINTKTITPIITEYFCIQKNDAGDFIYVPKNIKTLTTRSQLRELLYENGFYCNGIHYVRFKRSSGSSRVGKCLFIDEKLYSRMHKWEMCGLKINEGDKVDLAALEAYISLPTSSIIDIIHINPKNILIIDDYVSTFEDTVIATSINKNKRLESSERKVNISNSIWDGQSLIDESIMGKYKKNGMLLLRNRFFKSCCFNTKIQKYFKDNNIVEIEQLNGFTLAKKIEDIKLITTPNSIKYLKFGTKQEWLNNIDSIFGIVKHEKPTHNFDGRMVQTHYQLLNTLQLSLSDVRCLAKKSLDYINLLNTDVDVMKYHLKFAKDVEIINDGFKNNNEIVYKLLSINDDFSKTKIYYNFKKDLLKSYIKNIKCGHVLINGTYATLFGNPFEMLKHSVGLFQGNSEIGIGNVYTKRYENEEMILGCRSPHVTMGNILVAKNKIVKSIDDYFNLTNEIICINSIKENILERLSSADFDSDQMIISNEKLLLDAAIKNYNLFKVPTSLVEANKKPRFYTNKEKADLDIKTSINKIGEIINLSQELNTLLWHKLNNGSTFDDVEELYWDIAKLDVMSCIEIDKAKKEFEVDNTKELKILKDKYMKLDKNGKVIKPNFFGFVNKTKGYYNPSKKNYKYHDTTMDYLHKIMKTYRSDKTNATNFLHLTEIFKPDDFELNINQVNYKQINNILELTQKTKTFISALWATEDGLEKSIKREMTNDLKYKLYSYVNGLKINLNTTYFLISCIDREEFSGISRLLLYVLFTNSNSSFFYLMMNSKKNMKQLIEDDEGNIKLYDFTFKKE